AFYSPKRDQVVLPPRGAFNSELGNEEGAARYYGTLLHEIGHATGAAHRLNREGITGGHRFGSEGYAKEELRAEMFSLFAAAQTGIPYDPERHAAYVQDWAKVLKNDKNEIFRAAAEAGKAVDYVLDKERALQITQERQASVDVAERAAEQQIDAAPGAGLTLISLDQIRPGIDLVDMEKNRMSRVLTVERNPAGTTTTTEQNLDTGTRRHMTYWEGDEIVATALSLKVKDPEQTINAEAQQGKTDSTKKPPTMHEALESSGWKQTPHGSYEKTFLLDKDRNKGGEFTRGQTVAEKILSVKTAPDGFVMAHGWEDISVPVKAGLPPAQAVTELDNAAKERLMTEHGKSLGVTSIRGKGETQALPTKPPHEMTFAEFAQVATVRKLGPNHGREWEVFSDTMANGKSLGFADGPTAEGALRQAHKREVNNALYGNQPDTPEFLQKSMPSARVLDEYPDLQEKFAPAIKEYRQMLDKEDRKASEYQMTKQAERAAGHDKPNAADPAADKSPEPPEADKTERPARPRLRQSHRKAAAMER
ncbi:MAG: zincin-like metallopeptidase domain-containing protein, partial [Chloroflexota bacterium]